MKTIYLLLISLFPILLQGQEIIPNNRSFETDFQGWQYGVWGDAKGKPVATFTFDKTTGVNDKASFKIKVKSNTRGGNGDKVVLRRPDLKFKKNKDYTLTFYVKSRYVNDNMMVSLYSAPDTGSKYGWGAVFVRDFSFTGNGKWQKITYDFTATGTMGDPIDYKNMHLIFGFDKRRGTYWIDDISVVKK